MKLSKGKPKKHIVVIVGIWIFAVATPLAFAAMPAIYYVKSTFLENKTSANSRPLPPVSRCGGPSVSVEK